MCQLFISNVQKPHADRSWTCWSNRTQAVPATGAIAPLLHSPSRTLHRFPFATLMNFPLLHQRENRAASSHTLLQADIHPRDTTAVRVLPSPLGPFAWPAGKEMRRLRRALRRQQPRVPPCSSARRHTARGAGMLTPPTATASGLVWPRHRCLHTLLPPTPACHGGSASPFLPSPPS